MTLVMTLLARDEIDVVDSWLAFHLNAGVDLVIATDNRSQDGTTEVLEQYARYGPRPPDPRAGRGPAPGRVGDAHGAPRGDRVRRGLGDQLRRGRVLVAARGVAVARCSRRCRRATGRSGRSSASSARDPATSDFAERMTVRFSALAPINDPASLYKPIRKIVHRGHPEIRLTRGNHALVDSPFAPLRGWFPIECFHFPLRSAAQCAHKAELQGDRVREAHRAAADRVPRGHVRGAPERPDRPSTTSRSSSPTTSSSAGVAEGRLVVDTRLRDALRQLATSRAGYAAGRRPPRFPLPTLVEDAEYAVEAAVLGEADVVRLQRRLDELERRLQTRRAAPAPARRTGSSRAPRSACA